MKMKKQGPGVVITRSGGSDETCLAVYAAEDVSELLEDVESHSLDEVMVLTRPHKEFSMPQVRLLADGLCLLLDHTSYTMALSNFLDEAELEELGSLLSDADKDKLVPILGSVCHALTLCGLDEFSRSWGDFVSFERLRGLVDSYALTHDVLRAKGDLSRLNVSERLQLTYNGEVYAHGVLALNGFVLFEGSRVRGDEETFVLDDRSDKEAADLLSVRVRYFTDGTVIDDCLTRDVAVLTANDAAGLVLGELADGGAVWQTVDGRPSVNLPIYRDHLLTVVEMLRQTSRDIEYGRS